MVSNGLCQAKLLKPDKGRGQRQSALPDGCAHKIVTQTVLAISLCDPSQPVFVPTTVVLEGSEAQHLLGTLSVPSHHCLLVSVADQLFAGTIYMSALSVRLQKTLNDFDEDKRPNKTPQISTNYAKPQKQPAFRSPIRPNEFVSTRAWV